MLEVLDEFGIVPHQIVCASLVPSISDAVFNTFQIMQATILTQKLASHPPDIYIEPEIIDIRILEFYKADQIFKQADSAKNQLRRELEKHLKTGLQS